MCGVRHVAFGKDVPALDPSPDKILQAGGFELAKDSPKGPTPQLTISFVVPDKVGTWHYACFEEKGAHYTKHHMVGTITIVG